MATKKWFVITAEGEMGPLGPHGLRKLARRGEIEAETMVRREDHSEAVPAARVQGLLPAPATSAAPSHRQRNRIYGPYNSLRTLGWSMAGAMFAFAALGAIGVWVALGQFDFVARYDTEPLLAPEGDAVLFGAGVFAVLALVAVGGLFMWWIWTARVNLPHLINAHITNPPLWAVVSWLVPLLNLVKPYAVVSEIDRLSAEAEADGDATVDANHGLLVPWWVTAIGGTVLALSYMLTDVATIEQLELASWLHLGAAACTVVSGLLAGWIVLRITNNQESAHDRHPEPVELHHEFGQRRRAGGRVASG